MQENLLTNPGFELGDSHGPTKRWTPKGADSLEFDNIDVPDGHTVWWREEFPEVGDPASGRLIRRPEVKVIRLDWVEPFSDPTRMHGGLAAVRMHTFWGTHDMGIATQVVVAEAGLYQFSIFAHSLYTRCSGHYHDDTPYDGDCKTKLYWATDNLLVGIDPQGLEPLDPLNPRVKWAPPVSIYGKYSQEPLSVQMHLEPGTATLLVRAWCTHALKHNDVYLDDAAFTRVEAPPSGECPGQPREQYRRKYNVVPSDLPQARRRELYEQAADGNETVGPSFDDAGMGALEHREVVLWDIPTAQHDEYNVWYEKWYPGALVSFGDTPEDPFARWVPYALCQRKPIWAGVVHAGTHCHAPQNTIGKDGCWLTVTAAAQNVLGIREDATPVTVNNELGPSGFTSNCEVTWNAMKRLGLEVVKQVKSPEDVRTWLTATGHLAFADVVTGEGKHFWLVCQWDSSADSFIGIDPWYGEVKWLLPSRVENYRLIRKYQPAPEPEPGPEPEPPGAVAVRVGPHLQRMRGGWAPAKPGMAKLVGMFEECWNIWAQSPETQVVLRHFTNDYGAVFGADTPREGAEIWWSYFSDSVMRLAREITVPGRVLWVEGPNEVYGTFTSEIDRWVQIEMAFCDVIAETGLPIRPVVFCAAVGNTHESEFHKLVPLARKAVQVGGRFGYHPYWIPDGLAEYWPWLPGRWQEMDKAFAAHGVTGLRWLMGEGGLVGGHFVPDSLAFLSAAMEARPRGTLLRDALSLDGRMRDGRDKYFVPRQNAASSLVALMAENATPDTAAASVSGGFVLLPKDGWKSPTGYGGDFNRYLADLVEFNERLRPNACCTLFTTGGEGWGWGPFEIGDNEWPRIAAALAP